MKRMLLALAVVFLSGCGTYRLVEVDINTDMQTKPELTTVPQVDLRIAKYRNVVISYSKEYYSSKDASSPAGTTTLMSGGGIWITEIEREFVKKGFRVLSRQKYNDLLREKGVSASREVASLLGADLIIQINSLEYSPKASLIDKTNMDFKVYVSDSSGKKIARGRNSEENREALDKARSLVYNDVDSTAYMALLDCKIIDAKTGELIIFYRNQIFKLRSGRKPKVVLSYLLELNEEERWDLDEFSGVDIDKYANETPEGINRSLASQIKIEMIRTICSDLVNKLNDYRRDGKQKSAM